MRSLLLRPNDDESLLLYAFGRLREAEDDFMYIGRAFLSLLASAEGEYLDSIRTKLLPHELSLESLMPYRNSFNADSGVDLRPCSNQLDTRSFRSHLASKSDMSDWRNCPDKRFVPEYPASTSPAERALKKQPRDAATTKKRQDTANKRKREVSHKPAKKPTKRCHIVAPSSRVDAGPPEASPPPKFGLHNRQIKTPAKYK